MGPCFFFPRMTPRRGCWRRGKRKPSPFSWWTLPTLWLKRNNSPAMRYDVIFKGWSIFHRVLEFPTLGSFFFNVRIFLLHSGKLTWQWKMEPPPDWRLYLLLKMGILQPAMLVSNNFYFHPYLGKIPILTNIFQMGWNHQLDRILAFSAPQTLSGPWFSLKMFFPKTIQQCVFFHPKSTEPRNRLLLMAMPLFHHGKHVQQCRI